MSAIEKRNGLFGVKGVKLLFATALLIPLTMGLTGCDDDPSELEDYNPDPVLTAFLKNGQPVDSVMVEWVGSFHATYDPAQLGINDADVVLYPVLDPNGSAADSSGRALYFHHVGPGGKYVPNDANFIPEPLVRYAMRVTSPDAEMYAETTMPDTFTTDVSQAGKPLTIDPVTNQLIDSNGYTLSTMTRSEEELFFRWSESEGSGGYLLGIHATGDPDTIRPLDAEYDSTDADQVEFWEMMPKFVYTPAPDYQNAITLAWIYLNWTGPTDVLIQACSDDYYLYMFTSLTFQGADNIYSNVQGGYGIFGALTQQTVHIEMALSPMALQMMNQ